MTPSHGTDSSTVVWLMQTILFPKYQQKVKGNDGLSYHVHRKGHVPLAKLANATVVASANVTNAFKTEPYREN